MPEVQLDANDVTRQVEATVGDYLVVALHESPSTGQNWFAQTSEAAIVRQECEAFVRSGPLIPGGVGTRQFRFLAVSTGEATLSFNLAFAATGTFSKRFSIYITVR